MAADDDDDGGVMKPGLEFDLVTYSVCNMISVFLSVRCVQALSSVCVCVCVLGFPLLQTM